MKGKTALENHLASVNVTQLDVSQKFDKFVVARNSVLDEQGCHCRIIRSLSYLFHHSSFNSMNCTAQ